MKRQLKDGSAPTNAWKRVRDIMLEVVVAVALVTGGIVYVASHPRSSLNWAGVALLANTVVVFGYLISWFRAEWRRLVFWAMLVVLLLGHVLIYIFVVSRISQLPLAYYLVLTTMELALFQLILRKLLNTGDTLQP